MIYTVGIDPGKTGAAALLNETEVLAMADYSDGPTVAKTVRAWQDLYAPKLWVLERVHAMPKQGVKSVWAFAANYGWWVGVLDALCAPWTSVTPQTWMKGLPRKRSATDKPSWAAASRLYPGAEFSGPRGKKLDGRTDAVMIARWGLRQVQIAVAE